MVKRSINPGIVENVVTLPETKFCCRRFQVLAYATETAVAEWCSTRTTGGT